MNLNFKKINVTYVEKTKNEATFTFGPLNRGFGNTIGNTMRRVLMSSIPGTSIIGMRINGTSHEFERIKGSINTGVELINAIKKMKFALDLSDTEVKTLGFTTKNKGTYKASDIELPAGVKCLTPDVEFIKVNGTDKIQMEFYLKNGKGFVDASLHKELAEIESAVPVIGIDALFSPVVAVSYEVIDEVRVGRDANYEEVVLKVETNGEISAVESVQLASQILIKLFGFVEDMKEYVGEIDILEEENEKESHVLDTKIEELGLTARPYNKLKDTGYDTVGKILNLSKSQLFALGQIGTKSINEIEQKIHELGYRLKEDKM